MSEEKPAPSVASAIGAESNSSRPSGRSSRVFLGVPHSGLVFSDSISSIVSASLGRHDVRIGMASSSLLCYNFNRLWADALNYSPRPDYFAMHHSDIWAPDGWVDTLIETLEQEGADMVSAVIPIKTLDGHTSTAVVDLEGYRRRRLTVREVAQLPPVFDARTAGALCGVTKTALVVNTGLWVCRFATLPGIEQMHFRTGDSIKKDTSGKFSAHVSPEDWLWSMDFAARGFKVLATTRVPVRHHGHMAFGIGVGTPWGEAGSDNWEAL